MLLKFLSVLLFFIPFSLLLHLVVQVIVLLSDSGSTRPEFSSAKGAIKGPKTLGQGLHCAHKYMYF